MPSTQGLRWSVPVQEKEDRARRMQRLLRRACHVVNLAREQDVPLKPGLNALIERRSQAIVAQGNRTSE